MPDVSLILCWRIAFGDSPDVSPLAMNTCTDDALSLDEALIP